MDALKRASFASKQLPAGPAPLASFEDLPSDELESPEDCNVNESSIDTTENRNRAMKEKTYSSNTTLPDHTPDTISSSTPRVESDFDSQFTLTPSDSCKTPLATDYRSESFSSLSKEDALSVKQKKGSVVSLGTYDTPPSIEYNQYNQRKSSWTDVFHNHDQNDRKALDQTPRDVKGTHHCKKKKSEVHRKEQRDLKAKDRAKFLGIFKGKKSGKNSDGLSSLDSMVIDGQGDGFQDVDIQDLGQMVSEGKENEQPKQIELHSMQMQNDLDKSTTINNENSKTAGISKQIDSQNALNIAEKEYNVTLKSNHLECTKAINQDNPHIKKVEDEPESSESEIGSDAKASALVVKGNEIESEILLPQDSSEVEDDSVLELCPMVFKAPNPVPIMSKQQRQDVTTIPVERPRSTTPINAAPLEAFIRSASPSFDPKVEKIKLSLPGEQFLGRLKSPKRGSSKSWADFCVEVLHSPHMQKRDDFPKPLDDVFNSTADPTKTSCWDKFEVSESQWVTFESSTGNDNLPDLFQDLAIKSDSNLKDGATVKPSQSNSLFSKCPCQCHYQGCDNVYIDSNQVRESFISETVSTKMDLFSDKCQCQCHEKFLHLWSPTSFTEDLDFVGEKNSTEVSNHDVSVTAEEV